MVIYYRIINKVKRLLKKAVEIPSYEVKRSTLSDYKEKYGLKTLVETGTFMGDTVEYFKHSFNKVISIELAEELATNAKKRFEQDDNVTIIQGDSGEILKETIKNALGPMLFWLDGHYSSEFFVGELFVRTAKTHVNTPVEEELKTIMGCNFDHVILIDDARLFTGLNDYPSLSKVRRIVRKSGKKYKIVVANDIIRITPKQ